MSARLARAACSPAEKTILSNGGSDEDAGQRFVENGLFPALARFGQRNAIRAERSSAATFIFF